MGARTAGLHRGGAVRHAGKRLVIDLHQRRRILGDVAAVGDDDGDRLAGIDGLGARERMGHVERGDRGTGHEQRQRIAAQRLRQVGEGEHQMHAGEPSCRLGADAADFRVRIGAAHERGVQCSGQAHVVDEAALAGEQRRILLALDRGAEPLRSHGMLCPLRPVSPVVAMGRGKIHYHAAPEIVSGRRIPADPMLDKPADGPVRHDDTRRPALDFQAHIADLEARGLLVRVDRPINKDTELHPLVRWQFLGGIAESARRAFLFTNVIDARGRRYDIPVVVGALAASPQIYAVGMGQEVEDIGAAWMRAIANPIPPVAVTAAPCQEVVITGAELRRPGGGLAALPVPVSTPGFDSAPYLTATLCITRDPDSGVQNMGMYRAALKATDRLAVRMVARPSGGAGGYYHWLKYNARREPMPIAIAIGCAPVVMFTGPQKLAVDLDELAVAGGLAGAPIRMVKCKTVDLVVPADAEIVIEGHHRSGKARAGSAVRREQRLCRARGLQHADAGDRDHPQARAGVHLDHQPGDAERIERDQESGL